MTRAHTRRFPTPIRHDGRDYLTTEQVAKVLGVKLSTVYAYVSRGRLHSSRIAGYDGSMFAVDEVDGLLQGSRHRPPAGVAERIRTQLTYLHDDRLHYRGHDVADLARTTGYEDVAQLLWGEPWTAAPPAQGIGAAVRRVAGTNSRGLDRIRLTVDLLGARDPLRHHIEPAAVTEKATRVLVTAVDALAPGESEGSLAQRLWPRLTDEPATPRAVKVLNAALVALADHDLAAGTVAARVAASARGSVYAVIGAGLGAFDGPMHGGATTLAYRFLADALDDPTAAIADALYADTHIPGTGHVIYRARDPRATVLLQMLARSGGGDRRVQPAVTTIVEALGPSTFVNSDLALAALALRYRMRPDAAETIFALARIAGWIAHALEEYQAPRLRFRPEGVYTGVRPSGAHAT
ncbi:putative citrate synthase [Gordonia polyisoprenivorans NBRC 16320 = JCM 10675]|uniref:citrate synthase (unknown stereospecificity) n=1 Tax=Gordonia polyisoprenivorans TaxID=84595 RepID=A0A846WGD3_9ACTN|nr:citrate synthase [Gordonia polyisoprenivorans]NKY00835.1 helix-turn-helix domain-containing protein [Gordonia polyisoprenivorans]GAB22661.1 putative citrate synthase [Gordonia polyisoprenivorans NBRC 16320 = JCM 10675]